MEYYQWAMSYIEKRVDHVQYYIFSNDFEWATQYFNKKNMLILNLNSEEYGYRDLYLMSQCKHNILANSSFSWWGAWLNTYKKKIVIAPRKWFNTIEAGDIYCTDWIKCDL